MNYQLPFIIFDPECPLCVRFKQAIERLAFDIEIKFYPIDDKGLLEEFSFLKEEEIDSEVHLVLENNRAIKGADVISYLASHNNSVKKYAWLLETNVGKKASEAFYHSVNRLRESLHNHCPKCKNRA